MRSMKKKSEEVFEEPEPTKKVDNLDEEYQNSFNNSPKRKAELA